MQEITSASCLEIRARMPAFYKDFAKMLGQADYEKLLKDHQWKEFQLAYDQCCKVLEDYSDAYYGTLVRSIERLAELYEPVYQGVIARIVDVQERKQIRRNALQVFCVFEQFVDLSVPEF